MTPTTQHWMTGLFGALLFGVPLLTVAHADNNLVTK